MKFTSTELPEWAKRAACADLARATSYPGLGASLADDRILHPEKVCPECRGVGVSERPGAPAGSCGTCRGLRRVDMTLDEIRAAYRSVRAFGVAALGTTPELFDRIVAGWVSVDGRMDEPGVWLASARTVLTRAGVANKKRST